MGNTASRKISQECAAVIQGRQAWVAGSKYGERGTNLEKVQKLKSGEFKE